MTNSNYRWVIVAAGGVLGCVAIGGMFSLPVFLQPIARDTGWHYGDSALNFGRIPVCRQDFGGIAVTDYSRSWPDTPSGVARKNLLAQPPSCRLQLVPFVFQVRRAE